MDLSSTGNRRQTRFYLFLALWIVSLVFFSALIVLSGDSLPAAPIPSIVIMSACTAAFLWWLPGPVRYGDAERSTNRVLFIGILLAEAVVLFVSLGIIGSRLLFVLVGISLILLVVLRPQVSPRKIVYIVGLAVVAAVAALGTARMVWPNDPLLWAGLQFALVITGLPAGWAILRRSGIYPSTGYSVFVCGPSRQALKAFGWGALIALPWGLFNVAMNGPRGDTWVTEWWMPITAIAPGIAEEAWGRVLLVSLLFWGLSKAGKNRIALLAAVLLGGFWFAYLHFPEGLSGIPSALLVSYLFSIPLSFLWLRKGLETAIGFHFIADLMRFAAAFLANSGVWS